MAARSHHPGCRCQIVRISQTWGDQSQICEPRKAFLSISQPQPENGHDNRYVCYGNDGGFIGTSLCKRPGVPHGLPGALASVRVTTAQHRNERCASRTRLRGRHAPLHEVYAAGTVRVHVDVGKRATVALAHEARVHRDNSSRWLVHIHTCIDIPFVRQHTHVQRDFAFPL